jgi:hypothetical protein
MAKKKPSDANVIILYYTSASVSVNMAPPKEATSSSGTRRLLRLQSAMEYLMTYGWSVLIIAVILGILMSIGAFGGASTVGTTCIASVGYICQSPIYNHNTGNIVVTLGQNTGTTWTAAGFVFVPQGTSTAGGIPNIGANTEVTVGAMGAGQRVMVNLPVANSILAAVSSVNVGSSAIGTIWACYGTASGYTTNTVGGINGFAQLCPAGYYVQLATVTAKAS